MTAVASEDVPETRHRLQRRLRAAGLPSAAEITGWITDLRMTVRDITRAPHQVWGVEQFTARDEAGKTIELSVYGRDASDARMLAKLWRFCLYRDSGPTLILDRLQQVEDEAYLTLMAGRAGVPVPDVLAAGQFGPSRDAALVTRLPDGPALSQADGAGLADDTLDEILLAGLIAGLTSAGIPQDQAVAAVLIQRFFTSYLPPVWGWATLVWMRRREYV